MCLMHIFDFFLLYLKHTHIAKSNNLDILESFKTFGVLKVLVHYFISVCV